MSVYLNAALTGAQATRDRDDAAAELHAAAVRLRRLKPGAGTAGDVAEALNALVGGWSDEVRPDPVEVDKALAWIFSPEIRLPAAPAARRAAPAKKIDAASAGDDSQLAVADALELSDLHESLRWLATGPGGGGWARWDGCRWLRVNDRLPVELQREASRHVGALVSSGKIHPRATASLLSASGLRGIGELLGGRPSMHLAEPIDPPGILVLPRCALDLESGAELPHDPARSVTRCAGVDPGGDSPLWAAIEARLKSELGDGECVLRRFVGGALLGRGIDRRIVWLHGRGGDGKSVLTGAILRALGDYAAPVAAEVISGSARGAHGHELGSTIFGARLAVSAEASAGSIDWQRIKTWSGGDSVISKRLHQRAFIGERLPALIVVSNDPPRPPDEASAGRIIRLELQPVEEPDERIRAALAGPGAERDLLAAGCLAWALRGCAEFTRDGLGPHTTELHESESLGLSGWWTAGVAAGRLLPGAGWSALADLAADLEAHADGVWNSRELAAFLRAKVTFKHYNLGNRYMVGVKGSEGTFIDHHTRVDGGLMPSPSFTSGAVEVAP